MPHPELWSLAQDVRDYLDYMASLGVDWMPRPAQPADNLGALLAPETLDDIRADLGDCRRCKLFEGRNHIVFGEGPAETPLMFVGDGPGLEEDRLGRPFQGEAGGMLTGIIVKGMKRRREDCYLTNLVKCRPPENRDPQPDETGACLPFLHRQIDAVRPRVIVALGRTAAAILLGSNAPMAALRGRVHDLRGIPVIPTYHPQTLVKTPELKRPAWEDIQRAMAILDAPPRN
jgi:DNA polymerase